MKASKIYLPLCYDIMTKYKSNPRVIKAAITRVIKKIKRGWTKGALARDKSGEIVEVDDPTAVCWCAVGAMASTIRNDKIYNEVFRLVNGQAQVGILGFNDSASKKSDVIRLFESVYSKL